MRPNLESVASYVGLTTSAGLVPNGVFGDQSTGEAGVAHKFEIFKDKAGEFRVRFKYNSEVMFSTEGYASKSGAKNAIESIKKNAPDAEIDDTTD